MEELCEPSFWKDPMIIFREFNLKYKPQCKNQVWNFAIRLMILAAIVGLIGVPFGGWITFLICILMASVIGFIIIVTNPILFYPEKVVTIDETQLTPTVSSYETRDVLIAREAAKEGKWNGGRKQKEGFSNPNTRVVSSQGIVSRIVGVDANLDGIEVAPYSGPSLPDHTPPSARNPFMNVLLDEYNYNPQRPSAADVTNPAVKQTLDDYFRVQWFSDPTDVFGKSQSQRQFVTQPSTSIPNDRDSYQNWLYKIPGKTCKEGGRDACLSGSDGGPVTWLNQDV